MAGATVTAGVTSPRIEVTGSPTQVHGHLGGRSLPGLPESSRDLREEFAGPSHCSAPSSSITMGPVWPTRPLLEGGPT
jgi:hypothetical protein